MFRFTIRDLLWLMVVVGLGFALYAARNEAAQARLEAASYERSAKHWRGNTISFAKTAKEYAGFTMQVIDENGNRMDPISGKVLTSAEYK
jgi:hypothetical protein